MKNILTAGLVVFVLTSTVAAFESLGPSVPDHKWKQASVSLEYTWSEMDIEADGIPELGLRPFVFKNSSMNKTQVKVAVAVTDDLELFMRSGVGNIEGKSGSSSDDGFLLGGGMKLALIRENEYQLGLIVQTGWGGFSFGPKTHMIEGVLVNWEERLSFHEVVVATGPVFQLDNNTKLYGGPFLHFITGRDEVEGLVGLFPVKKDIKLEQDDILGGYIGTLIQLTPRSDVSMEFQATGSDVGAAISLRCKS
jgi:hypothetical protein